MTPDAVAAMDYLLAARDRQWTKVREEEDTVVWEARHLTAGAETRQVPAICDTCAGVIIAVRVYGEPENGWRPPDTDELLYQPDPAPDGSPGKRKAFLAYTRGGRVVRIAVVR